MSKRLALLRVQVYGFLNPAVLRQASGKEKRRMIFMAFAIFLLVGLSAVYTTIMALGFSAIGMIEALPPLLLLLCAFVTLIFTFLKSGGMFFGFKDYDLTASVPVCTGTIITSRLLSLYLFDLLFTYIMLAPALVIFLYGAYPLEVWVICFLLLLLAPMLPLAIGIFASGIITVLSMKLRHGSIVNILLSLACIVLLIVFSFGMAPHGEADFAALGASFSKLASQIYPPADYFQAALVGADWEAVLMFVLISVIPILILRCVLCVSFEKINSALFSRRVARNFRLGSLQQSSASMALYRKELRHIFSSATYFLNTVIGVILLVIFGAALLITDPQVMAETSGYPGLLSQGGAVMPLFMCFFVFVSAITSVSMNLEGKARWLPFSLPITSKDFFNTKIALCMTMHLPAIFISAPLFAIAFQTDFATTLLLFIIPICASFYIAALGLVVNLKFPRYDWASEHYAVKQSASALITLALAFAAICLPLVCIFLLGLAVLPTIIVFGVAMLAAACILLRRLMGVRLYL